MRHGQDDDHDDLRIDLARAYSRETAEAPPVPRRLRTLARGDTDVDATRIRHDRVRRLLAGAALTVGVVGVFAVLALLPRPRADASPATVLSRAASRYLELEDARLSVTLESEAIELLDQLLSDEPSGHEALTQRFVIRIRKPNRFLFWSVPGGADLGLHGAPLAGFDGERGWSYEPETHVAEVANLKEIGTLDSLDITRFLSFEFVRQLESEKGRYEIVELDRPGDTRRGLRTFRIKEKDGVEALEPWMWNKALISVDAENDRIERAEIAIRLGPLSLVEATLDVLAINEGSTDDDFAFENNVPEDAKIVEGAVELDGKPHGGIHIHIGGANQDAAGANESAPDGTPPERVLRRTGLAFAEIESVIRRNIISTRTPYGLKVEAVAAGSPAERAGIEPGDLVMKVDGRPLRSTRELADQLASFSEDSEVPLELSRRVAKSVASRSPWKTIDTRIRLRAE